MNVKQTRFFRYPLLAGLLIAGISITRGMDNLDFENHTHTAKTGDILDLETGLPGWSVSLDGEEVEAIYWDDCPLDGGGIGLIPLPQDHKGGNRAIVVQGGIGETEITLTQSGTVPADATEIRILPVAIDGEPSGEFVVFLGNRAVPLTWSAASGEYVGSVGASAGKTTDLQIIVRGTENGPVTVRLGHIRFQ